MTPFIPDVATPTGGLVKRAAPEPQPDVFGKALDAAGAALGSADAAEENFSSGTGSLQTAIYERARADVMLAVATAAAQRAAQALQTILTMQV